MGLPDPQDQQEPQVQLVQQAQQVQQEPQVQLASLAQQVQQENKERPEKISLTRRIISFIPTL
jgi:hypothetical protein